MWHKSDGDGVLEGAEARLLKVAVASWVEDLRGSDCWDVEAGATGGPIDQARESWLDVVQVKRMEHGQRLHMIATVVRALLERNVTAPDLTADSEATVYQIYQFLRAATDIEYDMLDCMQGDPDMSPSSERLLMSTRRAIADATRELGWCEQDEPGGPSAGPCGECEWCAPDMGTQLATWYDMIEALADTVLWDRDWEVEAAVGDAGPETTAAAKAAAGIEDGYFTTPAEEPSARQVAQAKTYLESIADEIRVEDEATAGV